MDHYYVYKSTNKCLQIVLSWLVSLLSLLAQKFFYDGFNKFYSFNFMFKSMIHLKLTLMCGERFEVEIHFSFIYPLVTVPFVKFGVTDSQFTVNSDS